MPGVLEAITFISLSIQAGSIGGVLAGLGGIFTGLGAIGQLALSVGLSYLSSALFAPKQPKPEDVQTSVKNPTAPRQRHYGRVKTSGPWVFGESKWGNFYKVIALGTGQLDAIEELWIDDSVVTVDSSGNVQETPWQFRPGDYRLVIQTRLGLATETHYADLEAVFPEWDDSHVGNGVASLFAIQKAVGAESLSDFFPNITNTSYRAVVRGSKVYNPSTGTTIWSDNAAAVIRDYASHSDGARLPASLFTTTQATAGWLTAYERAAVAIDKKAGGTENAYRLWGSYTFNERPADVLGRMLQCADARFVPTPDGGVTLDIGTWAEPTVTLDEDTIVSFQDVSRGRDILTTANVISATYMSPTHDYQATDADRWIDEDDVSERGEIVSEMSFNMSPSHGQTRRLMKLSAYRAKPNWVGTFTCNLPGLAAFGERFVRITYPLFGIDEVFEVQDFRFDIGEGNILRTVTLVVQSMPQEAYDWDADAEEGTEPISETTTVDRTIPVPDAPDFDTTRITISGQQVPYGVITFDEAPDGLTVEGRYKRTADSDWIVIAIDPDSTTAQFGALWDGEEYEAQIRYVTITGRQGEWSAGATETPVADQTAPGNCTSITVTGGNGGATVAYTTPVAGNIKDVVVYRVASGGTPTNADIVAALTQLVPPATATAKSLTDGELVANLLTNGSFAVDANWTKGTGWTIAAGKATHASGSAGNLTQTGLSAMTAGTYRTSGVVSGRTAGTIQPFVSAATQLFTAVTTNGQFLQSKVITAGPTSFGYSGGATFDGSVDDVVLFKETASCVPQGQYDYYVKARNFSGVGNLQGPYAATIV